MCIVTASFNAFFAAAIHAVRVRFSEDPDIWRDLVHLEEDFGEDGVKVESLACERRSVWGMLCADDEGIVSKSVEGLAKMMIAIVTVFEAAGLTVSEKKTETMLQRTPNQGIRASPHVIEAAGLRYMQTMQYTWAALSTQAPTLCQKSNDGSDSHGHATIRSSERCTIWKMLRSL